MSRHPREGAEITVASERDALGLGARPRPEAQGEAAPAGPLPPRPPSFLPQQSRPRFWKSIDFIRLLSLHTLEGCSAKGSR